LVTWWLALPATLLAAVSGVPALCLPRSTDTGQRIGAALQLVAAALGSTAAVGTLLHGGGRVELAWTPLLSPWTLGLDALSAWFLLPVCGIAAAAAVFDLAYWPQHRHPADGRRVRVFLGLLFAGLMGVLVAQDGLAFLCAWEVMALAAFFLVATEHGKADVRVAAWLYLGATHASTLVLFALFVAWQRTSGSFELVPIDSALGSAAARDTLFGLALFGFGVKAGIVPFHFWLPPAHASAPSHVSAVMSGVLIKTGIYGIARFAWLLGPPPLWWGLVLLGIGALSAVFGVAMAIGQHDLKRLLAYHSIENIGIICLGLGLALCGLAVGRRDLVALGLAGGLLHVWNHALFKGLLFLAAGATIHAVGTRAIDRLGGLGQAMPQTAVCFVVGAAAICGLPPLNGFVSELLTFTGLFRALDPAVPAVTVAVAAVAIVALAGVGGMALLCFTKVLGAVYLGAPRTPAAAASAEPALGMRLPMFALAGACTAIGVLPATVLPLLEPVVAAWSLAGPTALASLAPWATLSLVGPGLLAMSLAGFVCLRRRATAHSGVPTWDCGYGSPRASMQYTAASFAQQFVRLSRWLLLPSAEAPRSAEPFPGPSRFASNVPDLVLDRALLPALRGIAAACVWLRLLQRGRVQLYLLYVFLTLMLLLLVK
jgi:hydrogenase-4 component B